MDTPALGFDDPKTQGILALAAGLLQAGGPSRYPVPFGAALGSAMSNASKQQQQQALINLEQQKAALTQMQVLHGLHGMRMQTWALNGATGAPPTPPAIPPALLQASGLGPALSSQPPAAPSSPALTQTPSQPEQAPNPALTQTAPSQSPAQAPDTAGFNMNQLPPEARNAAQMDIAFNAGKGLPGIIQNSTTKIIPQVGMVKWDPVTQDWVSPAGFTEAMKSWKRAQLGVENENTPVDVALPSLPPGQKQRMTRAQELELLNPNNAAQLLKPDDRSVIEADMKRSGISQAGLNFSYPRGAAPNQAIRGSISASPQAPGITVGQPATVASEMDARGKALSKIEETIDEDARNAGEMRTKIAELRGLMTDFTPNKSAPLRQSLLEWKNSAPKWLFGGLDEKEMNEVGSLSGFGKIALGMAANATRQLGAREAAQIFDKMQQANPSTWMTQGGLDKVMGFMDKTAELAISKQSAKEEWKTSHMGSLEGFEANWNRQFAGQMQAITKQAKALNDEAGPSTAKQVFDALPPAKDHVGKTLRDTSTGKMLKSDGMSWREVK